MSEHSTVSAAFVAAYAANITAASADKVANDAHIKYLAAAKLADDAANNAGETDSDEDYAEAIKESAEEVAVAARIARVTSKIASKAANDAGENAYMATKFVAQVLASSGIDNAADIAALMESTADDAYNTSKAKIATYTYTYAPADSEVEVELETEPESAEIIDEYVYFKYCWASAALAKAENIESADIVYSNYCYDATSPANTILDASFYSSYCHVRRRLALLH